MTRLLLLFVAVVTSMATWASGSADQTQGTYCTYFYNAGGYAPSDVRVHVWGTAGNLTEWADNESMTLAGFSADGVGILKYEFSYDGEPEHIIFRIGSGQTPDLAYTDGALYAPTGAIVAPAGFEFEPISIATVYFYDRSGWDVNRMSVSGDAGATVHAYTASNTGLYYFDGTDHLPVYKFVISYTGELTSVSFTDNVSGRLTGLTRYFENGLYCYAGDHVVTDVIPDAPSVIEPWHKSYTVYMIAPTMPGVDNWAVHVWDEAQNVLTDWTQNETVTRTDKYTVYNDAPYAVYRYDFSWDNIPANIIFHMTTANVQSDDLPFADGALYVFSPKNVAGAAILKPGDYELHDCLSQTIYFADALGWGDNNIRAHIWGAAGDYTSFDADPYMTPTGKYTRVGDLYRPVYELTVTTMGDGYTDYVQIRRANPIAQSADNTFVDGGLYYYTRQPLDRIATDFELVDEIPVTPGTVYFHIGANQILTHLWEKPRAHFHLRDAVFELPLDDESDHELMREVDEGLWAADIDNTQLYDAVTFYYLKKNEVTGEMEAHTFPSTEPSYFDYTTYATYIYDIGTTCVYQSYMTPAQYEAERGKTRDVIYITGNSAAGFDDDMWTLTESQPIESEHGVFFREIVAGSQEQPTDFKLSWVNVRHYAEEAGEMFRYENQRGWATFNLGLYGYETRDVNWQVDTEYDQNHNRVQIVYPNMSVGYNGFNQYGWRVSSRSTPGHEAIIEGKTYWLVIDTHDDDRSVTLLDFDPNPHVTLSAGDIEAVELGYDRAAAMHSGDELAASATNGSVLFDRVNVASGVATVTAAENDKLDLADFSVAYTVYTNGIPVAVHNGKPDDISVPFIPVGDNVNIAVRARYTDTQTGYSFCSRYSSGDITNAPVLSAPVLSDNFKTLMLKDGIESADHWAFDAVLNLGYDIDTDLAVYPDYVLEATDGYHIDNPALADGGRLTATGRYPMLPQAGAIDWTAYSADGDYTDGHNWSKAILGQGTLPVHLESVLEIEKDCTEYEVNLSLTAHGVYPFLVNVASDRHAAAGSRAAAAQLPDDLSGYVIVPVTVSSPYSTTLGNRDVTGLDRVSCDTDADAAPVYYDLRGVRVDTPSAPGIYLERRGSQVRKIAIR